MSSSADLTGVSSIEELQTRLLDDDKKHPDWPWAIGMKFNDQLIGRMPNREDLDAAFPNKPCVVVRVCIHTVVVNTAALKLAGE